METRSHARWFFIVPSILAFWMIGNIDKLGISVVITNHSFLKAMGLVNKPAQIAMLSTAFTFTYAIANYFWGFVADRWGPRRVAIFGTSLWGLMMIAGGLSSTYDLLIVSRIFLGFGEAILWVVSTKFSASWFNKKEMSRAQSLWFIGNTLGPAIGAPMIVGVMAYGSWRAAFFLLAGLSLVVAMPLFVFLTRDTPDQHYAVNREELNYIRMGQVTPQPDNKQTGSISEFTSKWRYWFIVLAHVAFGYVFFGLSFWLPTYLKTVRHFSPSTMAGWTSISWIFGIAGALLAGYLIDLFKSASLIGILSSIIGAITDTASTSAAMLSIGVACQQAAMIVNLYLLQRFISARSIGGATGIMAGCSTLFGGFAPTVMGLLVAASKGSFLTGIYTLVICALIALVSYVLMAPVEWRSRREVHKESAEVQSAF